MMDWVTMDLNRHEREVEAWLRSRPVCDSCGEPIQDEYMYEINGDKLCEECWNEYVKDEIRTVIE